MLQHIQQVVLKNIYLLYNELYMAMNQCKNVELTTTLGDFIAKGGNEKVSGVTCSYGVVQRNNPGDKLLARPDSHDTITGITWFKHYT